MFNGDKTYDNQTGKIQQNRGTTYKKENHRVAGTSKLSGWSPRGTCNYGGCLHGGEGNANANKVQGHIQLASKSGSIPGVHMGTAEKSRILAGNKLEIDWKEKRVGTLKSQVHQLDGLLTRWHGWHVVA